ncbi:hypothetical protein [Pseudovibrio ascidiaceicola]|uniref:hypothetical protein n=1 Tax=Pseudovibrio ascidiaceicola TaxID=285279 RepID=UPI00135BDC28|nr:hypothetical protein [Pseudovibrio ascidiaceicola]
MTIIQNRTDAILRHFREDIAPPKVAISPDHNFPALERLFKGSLIRGIDDDVLYFESDISKDDSYVLVRSNWEKYRLTYVNFINSQYEQSFSIQDLPSGFDIDHLLAKSNAPPSSWIRLEAVVASSNRSHGAGVEKRNSSSLITADRKESNYHHGSMTWLSAAKLAGFMSPLANDSEGGTARLEELVQYFVNVGFERACVLSGVEVAIHDSKSISS